MDFTAGRYSGRQVEPNVEQQGEKEDRAPQNAGEWAELDEMFFVLSVHCPLQYDAGVGDCQSSFQILKSIALLYGFP
jgi:hypothetical protein